MVRAASPSAGTARADGGERAEREAEVRDPDADAAARGGETRVGQRNGGNTPLVPDAVGRPRAAHRCGGAYAAIRTARSL